MSEHEKETQRVERPVAPSTPEGTVPYTDPLPTPEADAAAPDGAPRPTRPVFGEGTGDDHAEPNDATR